MAGRSGFSVLAIDVDLDERAGKKKSDKQKPKTEESSKRSAGNKTPSKKKKAAPSITAVDSGQPSSGPAKIKNKKKSGKAVNGTDKDGQNKGNEHPHLKVDDDWQRRDDELTGRQEPEEPEGSASERMPKEEKFFENIDEAARKTLEKENRHENYKITAGQFNQALRATQYEAELEKRDFEIQALRLEVDSLKDDLKLVKGRNKKLCEVISASEMKSKAELVVELDKMTKVRDELTQEVQNLSAQLEQERSKVNQLSLDVKKAHGKKKQNNADAGNKD
ncbi:G kinase-anchoring protein 1-like isoform X2 [Eriocheir sinensis]|uniref:G kinase-anchoring protein 1-like isoform X2 n=1 Tax=Eriocheir sinensis TaxID=95602 RepID=UPI0021C90ACD|nr:G kinase-anchoring protein 1-like isoform X2 [Eriocheir sinensis]